MNFKLIFEEKARAKEVLTQKQEKQCESLCAFGACEEKAKVKRSYSNPHPKKQSEFECEDMLLLHTQKKRVSLGLRIFCSYTPKKTE